jgi:hypothetical protein
LSHDALVGVKWNRTSGFSSSQRRISGVPCADELSRIT